MQQQFLKLLLNGLLSGLLSLLLMPMASVVQAKKMALVIGNASYQGSKFLRSPVHDAKRISSDLRGLGFTVIQKTNADLGGMQTALAEFSNQLRADDIALFYYSGHGVQARGNNYLIPLRATINKEVDLKFRALNLAEVVANMEYAGTQLNIVILDACRDNPYKRVKSLGSKGLARVTGSKGTIIAYATAAGQTAPDGRSGTLSPYTTHLSYWLKQPVPLLTLFNNVAHDVNKAVPQQAPWIAASYVPDYCFKDCKVVSPRPNQGVAKLLRQCEAHLRANRLTTGAAGNALDCYRQVLAKDVGNEQALAGLVKIEDRYAALAQKAKKRGQRSRAKRYWQKLAQLNPEHHALPVVNDVSPVVITPKPKPKPKPVNSQMMRIRGGSFQMGSPSSEAGRRSNESQHSVYVSGFALARHEVTVGEFRRFVNASGYRSDAENNAGDNEGCYANKEGSWGWRAGYSWKSPGFSQTERSPVVCVSFNDAQAYIAWLNRQGSGQYRLPTEAEWEYAARAGSSSARFWGESANQACNWANVGDNTAKAQYSNWTVHNCRDGYVYTAPVGSFAANDWGLYDMLGNVWEWTCSEYESDYNGAEKKCSSKNRANGQRVLRGGSWFNSPARVRSALRLWSNPSYRFDTIGFRLAQD